MADHNVKLNRSRNLAGHLPQATAEIDRSLSPMLIERLTALELAEVRRCLNEHWHKAMAFKEQEIVGEGCVWSQQHQRLIELQF